MAITAGLVPVICEYNGDPEMSSSPNQSPPATPDLSLAMRRDQHRLRQLIRRIRDDQRRGKNVDQRLKRWNEALEQSVELRQRRQASLTAPPVDAGLPIADQAQEIAAALASHQVLVISGETGSGKSTQLPLICLQLGLGGGGFIGHTQPRRIAARGVAARIAEQLNSPLGQAVGYKIRFGDETGPDTLVKIMTDGILLAETASDRCLDSYEVIIIDEAHERSLNIDFLMGYLKRLLPKRPELKVIITSATIDTGRFAEHFTLDADRPVPVIHVEGRTFPVDIEYRPVGQDEDGKETDQDMESATVEAVLDLATRDRGDMLVFLPTEQAIRSLAKKLRSRPWPGETTRRTEILPLYARLSGEQQNAIFRPGSARRVVLATNVAESSITVPRIRYVIDQGLARISRYAPRSKVQRLPIEAISQASADQRAGRCGRLGPGICVRLYAEEDYQQRARFTTPEIRRTNLASVILQTRALQLGPIEEFPFLEAPTRESIRDGYKTLHEIGAVDERRELTPLGRKLSRLPVDPRIGRMLYAASDRGCLAEVLVIAAALEVQDPRVRPAEKQAAADEAHARFHHDRSDFLGMLNLWNWLHQRRESLSRNQFRKACAQNFLSAMLVQQWLDVYRQLRSLARDHRLHFASDPENDAAIHQSLLTGLLSGVAMRGDRREYTGPGGIRFFLWPGSGLVKASRAGEKARDKQPQTSSSGWPPWVLVAEIVETGQRFGRTVAAIDPQWIEPLAEHVVKRSYAEPHWSRKRQAAMAWEKVTLYGLPIVSRRPVRYGNIDPQYSRQLLIEQGLVADQMKKDPAFLVHNRRVLQDIRQLAARTRRRDLVIDEYRIRNFYDRRLPQEVFDGGELWGALKRDHELDQRLRLTLTDLVDDQAAEVPANHFPDELQVGDLRLPLQYRFAPGTADDGVTLRVPLEAVPQLHENHLGWSIPGLLQTRIVALIRSLPKSIRRNLVPAPETAAQVAGQIEFGKGAFADVIAHQLSRIAGQRITPDQFNLDKLDDSQRLNIQVCDEQGEVVAQARSLAEIKSRLPAAAPNVAVAVPADDPWHEDGLTTWSWDDLPEQIVVQRGVAEIPLFPTIVSCGDTVNLRLFDNRERARRLTRQGLATLYRLSHGKAIRSQVNWLPDLDRLGLIAARVLPAAGDLKPALSQLIASLAFVEGQPLPRTREAFQARQTNAPERIGVATQKVAPCWVNGWTPGRIARCVWRTAAVVLNTRPTMCDDSSRTCLSRIF
jgi:ATP-dependent helicase HrpA